MTGARGHSPLGASGSHRWMECPGSVTLSAGIRDEESDHAALGTAAHALAAACLKHSRDAWELIGLGAEDWQHLGLGDFPEGFEIDKDMADAVQIYLDAVRRAHPDRSQGNTFIERPFHCPSIHELFYGTTDFAYIDEADRALHVWDYKHGAGVVVEVKENPQLRYYGAGALEDLNVWGAVDTVVYHIAQPRGFHFDGPVREWSESVDSLHDWTFDVLVPAMNRAMVSRDTRSGEHCRFCPVRSRACPQLLADADELEKLMNLINEKGAAELTNEQIARFLDLYDVVKIAASAANRTAFNRLQAGHAIPGRKLAKAKANRVWKDGAEEALREKFGDDAYEPKTLKSPAQIEKLPEGEGFCARYAYKPDAGLTVVKGDDARPAVNKDTKSLFQAATAKRKGK